MLILCILRLRYHPRSVPAWAGVIASASFVGWASIATSEHGTAGKIVALSPLVAAVIATALAEFGGGETMEQFRARLEGGLADAQEALRAAYDDAHRAITEASEVARTWQEKATEVERTLTAELSAVRAAHAAEIDRLRAQLNDARTATPPPSRTARKVAGKGRTPADDLRIRRAHNDGVRAVWDAYAAAHGGTEMPYPDLARALNDLPNEADPSKEQLARARAQAQRWRTAAGSVAVAVAE
jgi:hypothetical protein